MRVIYIGGPLDGIIELRACAGKGIELPSYASRGPCDFVYHYYRYSRPRVSACVVATYVRTRARVKNARGRLHWVRTRKDGSLWPK